MEIRAEKGFAYVRAVGRDPGYGHAIHVYPRWFPKRLTDFQELTEESGYITFYPAQAAVNQGLVEIVASGPLPDGVELPTVFRRRGALDSTGKVLAWIVSRNGKELLKRKLTEEERRLPIASVWNHEFLVERIAQGWRPEDEG